MFSRKLILKKIKLLMICFYLYSLLRIPSILFYQHNSFCGWDADLSQAAFHL